MNSVVHVAGLLMDRPSGQELLRFRTSHTTGTDCLRRPVSELHRECRKPTINTKRKEAKASKASRQKSTASRPGPRLATEAKLAIEHVTVGYRAEDASNGREAGTSGRGPPPGERKAEVCTRGKIMQARSQSGAECPARTFYIKADDIIVP